MIHFFLYSCCFVTKGFSRGCLIDVERNLYCSIPIELCDVLAEGKTPKDSEFAEHILFLSNEGFLCFFKNDICKTTHNQIFTPYLFEDLIFDVSNINDFLDRINYINSYELETIQIRFYTRLDIQQINKIINILINSGFCSIELFFNHNQNNLPEDYLRIYDSFDYITKLGIFDYPYNCFPRKENVLFIKQKLISENQCGKINEHLFCPNLRTYLSSFTCNSCLYKKISIDKNGEIKNCPSMKRSYGNIATTELKELLNNPEFTKLWYITKDKVEVCKDCEFRNICTDCRCFLTDETNIFSKPKNCSYDPYTNKW